MNNIFMFIITFLLSTSPVASEEITEEQITVLDNAYSKARLAIAANCAIGAEFLYKVANQRDAGVPKEGMDAWLIKEAELAIKEEIQPPLKSINILNNLLLITLIYGNPDVSPDDVYEQQYIYCTGLYTRTLTITYDLIRPE